MNSQHTHPFPNCVEKNKLANLLAWPGQSASAPQKTILLVSKSKELQTACAQALQEAGYRTLSSVNLVAAVPLATQCQMSIIGNTYSRAEQAVFVNKVCASNPAAYVLCIRFLISQYRLAKEVHQCFGAPPGRPRIHVLEYPNVIMWPKVAS